MKNTLQHLTRLSLVLVLAHSLSMGQGIKTLPSADASNDGIRQTTKTEQDQEMRWVQLKTLQMSTLTRTVDSIKKIDEPALRISARIEILKYLTVDTELSEDDKALATTLAREALADFSEHVDEIMPSLAEYLISNLAVWIRKFQPSLSENLVAVEKAKMKGKDSLSIRALMALPGGDVLAARRITQMLEEGKAIPVLVLYLDALVTAKSQEVDPLMSKILAVAGQGKLSFDTLVSVGDLYLQPQTPLVLKQRFLRTVVAQTHPSNPDKESASQSAYDLLTNLLPVIQQVVPELSSQAANQRLIIYSSLSREQKATEERNKRLSESLSPIEDLIAAAEESKSKLKRNELLAEAAQRAMEIKKFPMCLEAVAKLDLDVAGISSDFWRNWNDQFIKEFVIAVLAEKSPGLAEKGAHHGSAYFAKVETLVMVMQYWGKAGDHAAARRLLTQARRTAGTATDQLEKAKAFLLISATADQAESFEKIDLLDSAITALNSVSMPERGDDLKPYQKYVWMLNGVEYQVTKRFKALTTNSNEEALALVERIDKADSRTFALLGILQGMRDLSRSIRG